MADFSGMGISPTDSLVFDATTNSGAQTGASYSWTHTTTSSSNRILIVGIASIVNRTATVTYNGVSMTKIREDTRTAATTKLF